MPMERAQRALAQRTSRRGFLGRVGRGFVALAGGSLVATALTHLVRVPYTTGLMVSTIESPQGPQSADQPAMAAATARAPAPASVNTASRGPGT